MLIEGFVWRGAERLLIVLGAILFVYLGYRLYSIGIVEGRTRVDSRLTLVGKLIVSGIGPGLAFMTVGGLILIVALLKGGVSGAPAASPARTTQNNAIYKLVDEISSDPKTTPKTHELLTLLRQRLTEDSPIHTGAMATLNRENADETCPDGTPRPCAA